MGIHNREYMQDEPAWRSGGGAGRDTITTLIIINVALYMLQVVMTNHGSNTSYLTEWFALDVDKVLHGQVWRLFTYDFLHSTEDYLHILINMLLLFMAGRDVEARYGSREFLWFYLAAGWASGLFYLLWEKLVASHLPGYVQMPSVGASGAVMGVLIVYVMHWPHRIWRLFGVIPIPVWLIVLLDVCSDVFPLLKDLGGQPIHDGVAHAAHAGGMLFAWLYVRQGWQAATAAQLFRPDRWKKMFRRRPNLRVHQPTAEELHAAPAPIPMDIEQRVDELLEKIAQQGEASLTSAERQFLSEASRRYRNRR